MSAIILIQLIFVDSSPDAATGREDLPAISEDNQSFSLLPASLLSDSLLDIYLCAGRRQKSRATKAPVGSAFRLRRPAAIGGPKIPFLFGPCKPMTTYPSEVRSISLARMGRQPIALTAAALLLIVAGVGSIAAWRISTGASPETDRAVAARALQTRSVQASEQLVEKTKGLEQTQQESIDQIQVMQDQLQTVRHQVAAQQADTKRLSDQITSLTEAVDGLRQSFASAPSSDVAEPQASHRHPARVRAHAVRAAQRRVRSHS
jgi:hypothetical protein